MRARWPLVVGGVAVVGVAGVLLVRTLSVDPVLLDERDVDGVVEVFQNQEGAYARGTTWCDSVRSGHWVGQEVVSSVLRLDDGSVGATILDRSADGLSAEDVVARIEEKADLCLTSDALDSGYTFEAIGGLDDDERGWRSSTTSGEHGEYLVVPLDEWRVLAVGYETEAEQPPVTLDRLVSLAEAGAAQFPRDSS